MPSTRATTISSDDIATRLKEAIDSERYKEALPLLAEYSACVARMYESKSGEAPPQKQVMELMQWAQRTLSAARAHASDQFQLLSNSRVYTASEPDLKTWQMML